MLDLVPTDAAAITCVGTPDVVAAAARVDGYACRVAPDELMLIAPAVDAARALAAVADAVQGSDALVVDASDGWTIWTLAGEATDRAMARLTAIELDGDGFRQGDVARVPVKIVTERGRVHLLVPAMWGAYLRERILARCASLQIREQADPSPWTATSGAPEMPVPKEART